LKWFDYRCSTCKYLNKEDKICSCPEAVMYACHVDPDKDSCRQIRISKRSRRTRLLMLFPPHAPPEDIYSVNVLCQACNKPGAKKRRQNTANADLKFNLDINTYYVDDEANFSVLCDDCQQQADEYWRDMLKWL
jgi:hypothetical protein